MFNQKSKEIHKDNVDRGFWDRPRSALEVHMLIVTELAEATEAVVKNLDSEAEEVLDALIRILDYAGYKKWDVDTLVTKKLEYNRTRGYRHGKEERG